MGNQSNQATKKGMLLLLGIVIGLLVGVLVAFTIVKMLNLRAPQEKEETIVPPTSAEKDTIYKYIVHRYEPAVAERGEAMMPDSLAADTMFADESSMDYMLEDDVYPGYAENDYANTSANISSAKLLNKYEAPILYFDANKNAVEAPANAPKFVEVQFWSTPIQNKISYQYKDNILKIKGLKYNEVYVVHYNNRYYLKSDRHVYQIQQSNDYQRLVEIHDVQFF